MKKRECSAWFIAVSLALFLAVSCAAPAGVGSVTVADSTQSIVQIAIAPDAGSTLRLAASELQRYIRQMCDAELAIREIGNTIEGGVIELKVSGGPSGQFSDLSSFSLMSADASLVITGASEYAVLIGAYDLLERLGCRWLGPGFDEVPRVAPLQIPRFDISQAPTFRWRGLELISGSTPAIVDWMAKSKLNVAWPEMYTPAAELTASETSMRQAAVPDMIARGMTIFWGGHILPTLMPEAAYADHPEYFAIIGGKRLNPDVGMQERNQLCVSNPESLRVLGDNTVTFLRNHPWIDVLFLWAGDTTQWCECDACRALLTDPDRPSPFGGLERSALYARMVKAVAERVEQELPGRRIAFNHYYNLDEVPRNADASVAADVLPPRNVLSAVDDYHQCDRHPFVDLACRGGKRIEAIAGMWGPLYDDSVSWSYYFAWNFTKGLPVVEVSKIFQDFRFVRGLGVNGIIDNVSLEPGSVQWLNNLPNFLAYAKAAWDPEALPEHVLDDFVAHWYGPCAPPMHDVWRLLETATREYGLNPEFMPADPALAAPAVIHGRMVDAPMPPNSTSAEDIRLLIPNAGIARRLADATGQAAALAPDISDNPFAFRVALLRSVLGAWDPAAQPFRAFGFLNGGAQNRGAIYQSSGSMISCTLVNGNNHGDCFWRNPGGDDRLAAPGDSIEVHVSVRADTEETGSPLYRSGPGLYQADSAGSICGASGAHNATFFIGNLDSDQSGPRRVILMLHDGAYATSMYSSADNEWEYGKEVSLRILYVGEGSAAYTYEYAYNAGDGWIVVATHATAAKLSFVAPSIHYSFLEASNVRFPIVNWAQVSFP